MTEPTSFSPRFTISPILSTDGRDEGMSVFDQTGDQKFLLKQVEEARDFEKGGFAADDETFNADDDMARAVDSPDLIPAIDPKWNLSPSFDFKLADNNGNTAFLVRATKKAKSGIPLDFEILDSHNLRIGSIEGGPKTGWYLKVNPGVEVAFSNLRIMEEEGELRQRTKKGGSHYVSVNLEGVWGDSSKEGKTVDRFTVIVPRTDVPLAQVYPGTSREGANRGPSTSDAFEIKLNADQRVISTEPRPIDERLIICFVEALHLLATGFSESQ